MVLRITSLSVKHKRTCRNGTTQTSNVKVSCLSWCFVCSSDHVWEKIAHLSIYLITMYPRRTCDSASLLAAAISGKYFNPHGTLCASRTHCNIANHLTYCVHVTCTYFSWALRQSDVTLHVLHVWHWWHGVRDARSRAVCRGLQFRQQWLHRLDCRAAVWRRPTVERCDVRRGRVHGAEGLRPYVTSTTNLVV